MFQFRFGRLVRHHCLAYSHNTRRAGVAPVPLDIYQLLKANQSQNYELHRQHVNPVFARVLKTIGFDRVYTRAQGPYLWDAQGNKYLDFMGGWAVLGMGRNHPTIKKALADFLAQD